MRARAFRLTVLVLAVAALGGYVMGPASGGGGALATATPQARPTATTGKGTAMVATTTRRAAIDFVPPPAPCATGAEAGRAIPVPRATAGVLPPASVSEAQLVSTIDVFFTAMADMDAFSGQVLVARGGEILLSKGYGHADRERTVPVDRRTRFCLGDLTMQFTASALLLLEQDGKLSLRDPICEYLPECPMPWSRITIHHLLSGSSGLAPWPAGAGIRSVSADLLEAVRGLRTTGDPGTAATRYNDTAHVLAGLILERVAGMSYGRFLEERIFGPLGMLDSGYGNVEERLAEGGSNSPGRAFTLLGVPHETDLRLGDGYSAGGGGSRYRPDLHFSAGGVYSTAEDLWRWDEALYTDVLLTEHSRGRLFVAYFPVPGEGDGWQPDLIYGATGIGYSWVVATHEGRRVYHSGGSGDGYAAALFRHPEEHLTILLLANRESRIGTLLGMDDMIHDVLAGRR